jgi:hypothetical protein
MKTLYKEDVFGKSQQTGLIKEKNVLKSWAQQIIL